MLDYHAMAQCPWTHTTESTGSTTTKAVTPLHGYHDDKVTHWGTILTLPQANQTTNSTKHQTKLQLQLFPLNHRLLSRSCYQVNSNQKFDVINKEQKTIE